MRGIIAVAKRNPLPDPEKDDGLYTAGTRSDVPKYDIRALVAYAQACGKRTDELTEAEVEPFRVKKKQMQPTNRQA